MNSKSLGTFTDEFYKKQKDFLTKSYPGLSKQRLKDEIEQFALQKLVNVDKLFDSQYVPSGKNPITYFFDCLKKGCPLEYIRGRAHFYKSEFDVTPSVLIPRSETEILVEQSVELIKDWTRKSDELIRVLDIGTGSGAIIISLLQESERPLNAFATDISKEALTVAKRNFFNLRYTIPKESSLQLICTDRMKDLSEEKFHVIVSNPPYIKEVDDREFVHGQVDSFEPHLALYLKDETYDLWFVDLFKQVHNSLYEEGIFFMEGHEDHLENLAEICRNTGFSAVQVLQDYTNRNRFILAKK